MSIKTVQRGIANLSVNVGNVSITAVDLDKSFVTASIGTGIRDDPLVVGKGYECTVRLTSSDNLQLLMPRDMDILPVKVNWEVVEFQ